MNETNESLYARLCVAIDGQLTGAREHCETPGYWQNTGHLERAVAMQIQRRIDGVSRRLSHDEYVQTIRDDLLTMARNRRHDDTDDGGYGVGTVHAIGREVPGYTAAADREAQAYYDAQRDWEYGFYQRMSGTSTPKSAPEPDDPPIAKPPTNLPASDKAATSAVVSHRKSEPDRKPEKPQRAGDVLGWLVIASLIIMLGLRRFGF